MKHARSDYNRIQDPENLIPEDEPVFLIRGKDVCAVPTLMAWCKEARTQGVDPRMIRAVTEHADRIAQYQIEIDRKIPDMP